MKQTFLFVFVVFLSPISYAFLEGDKVIVMELRFEGAFLEAETIKIQYGSSPNRLPLQGLTVKTLSKGAVIDSFNISDPRFVADKGYLENISFTIVMPYIRNADEARIFKNSEKIASISLSQSLDAFCRTKNGICDLDCKEDADCPVKVTEPKKPEAAYSYIVAIALVSIIGLLYAYRRLREREILKEVKKARR